MMSLLGLKVIKLSAATKLFPIEMAHFDRDVFDYVRNNRLSTSSEERLFATIMACQHVVQTAIEGDFVECGVWRGGNSIIAANVFKRMAPERAVWLFDTFAGMTAPTEVDINFRGESAEAKFRQNQREDHNEWCYSPLEEVKGNFEKVGLLGTNLRFIQGDVSKTLATGNHLPEKISVLRLDTDWYESTKIELEVLFPRLSKGGILILDDYGHWGGSRKAVDEYFKTNVRPFFQYIDHTARAGVKCN